MRREPLAPTTDKDNCFHLSGSPGASLSSPSIPIAQASHQAIRSQLHTPIRFWHYHPQPTITTTTAIQPDRREDQGKRKPSNDVSRRASVADHTAARRPARYSGTPPPVRHYPFACCPPPPLHCPRPRLGPVSMASLVSPKFPAHVGAASEAARHPHASRYP